MSENETGEREKSKKSPQIRECSQQGTGKGKDGKTTYWTNNSTRNL